jgi:Ni/Fe-hydrogenase 1 B-type cytochrome subunit
MNAAARSAAHAAFPVPEEKIVRVYVWQWPVRIAHWLIFLSICVLSFTGYYLYDPFIISRGQDAFVMGTVRFIHEVTGFVFIGAFLIRAYWFFKGNRWARWRQFLLLDSERWRGARNMLRYYLFLRRGPESRVGHNPLAGATYSTIYAFIVIEILTGLALFNHVRHSHVIGFFIGWLPLLISIQYLREIHFFLMFVFWAFFIHHIYSAWLMSIEERSGLIGSIFSGYKNLPADFVAADPASRYKEKFPVVGPGKAYWRQRRKARAEKAAAPPAETKTPE